MAVDLQLINDLWRAAQQAFRDEWTERAGGVGSAVFADAATLDALINYSSVLFAGMALLNDKALAQRFVDETLGGPR